MTHSNCTGPGHGQGTIVTNCKGGNVFDMCLSVRRGGLLSGQIPPGKNMGPDRK